MLKEAIISHLSQLILIVALSTHETKYNAICKSEIEAIWLRYLLAEMEFYKRSILVILYVNNKKLITLSNNLKFYY